MKFCTCHFANLLAPYEAEYSDFLAMSVLFCTSFVAKTMQLYNGSIWLDNWQYYSQVSSDQCQVVLKNNPCCHILRIGFQNNKEIRLNVAIKVLILGCQNPRFLRKFLTKSIF